MGFGFLFKVKTRLFITSYQWSCDHHNQDSLLLRLQVDDQSVFRHRGERKMKALDEEEEDVASSTAHLLEEGDELLGS